MEHCKHYEDADYTGRNSKRPGLRKLMADIKSGLIDVVVIYRLDRLYRSIAGLIDFVRLLREKNVRLISVTEEIDTANFYNMIFVTLLAAVGEMYVWQVSQNTRNALNHRAKQGLANGRMPLGYCNGLCTTCTDPHGEAYCPNFRIEDDFGDGRVPVLHPLDKYAVSLIYALSAQGWSDADIATHLNTHNFILPSLPYK
ncbi:MAG: hypothetical protein OHK0052_27480 [Anaerolineales bacterium]